MARIASISLCCSSRSSSTKQSINENAPNNRTPIQSESKKTKSSSPIAIKKPVVNTSKPVVSENVSTVPKPVPKAVPKPIPKPEAETVPEAVPKTVTKTVPKENESNEFGTSKSDKTNDSGTSKKDVAPAFVTQVQQNDEQDNVEADEKEELSQTAAWEKCGWMICCCNPQSAEEFVIPDEPISKFLLPNIPDGQPRKKCLVLDLDETLVHSSFKFLPGDTPDYEVEVVFSDTRYPVYVRKRPFVDEFLEAVAKNWEVVIFTASLDEYANPVLNRLLSANYFAHRLFRQQCTHHRGVYVKDLRRLGRPLGDTVIVDNNPDSYLFHPDYAIPITSWFSDETDRELLDLIPFLDNLLEVADVSTVLKGNDFPFIKNEDYS